MTWTYKHTRSDRPIVAEYLCPVHGRFALEVPRDENGDPPEKMPCPTRYEPRQFALFGADAKRREEIRALHVCGRSAPYVISAPMGKVKHFEVVRGKWEKPERPTYFDTRKLGEGQPLEEFRAERAKVWEEHRWHENKELLR